ncbi:hypothetical protein [Halocella sp. SP3-1]|uniref:hypothetical protein n=1 Tax=Halocella sp. SP3-1 TaxID=2382161 RepID=UPI000F75B675|nr:hypothetical protein [Halocella sp. SP3-1]AZO96217.1 hypothetical protein D7D81_17345 [Halocella sp. SP3-1]MTI59732.1 hypothetical protein [Bacillota bacterium]
MLNSFLVFTKKEFIYIIVIFLLGIITGATFLNLYSGRIIDQLILERNELTVKNREQSEQIKQLEEKFNRFRKTFINKINIELDTDVNKHTQQAIKTKISDLLAGLMGKEIEEIDPLLLKDVIHQRFIIIEDKTYQLELLYMVISDQLSFYIKVGPPKVEEKE